MSNFLKVAHRGASGRFPENSAIAFKRAIESAADMIELDCQQTADGHVVIFHDQHLRRLAGARGKVSEKNLQQLKSLDIGRWKSRTFSGERILTLEEALEIIARRTGLCLEIKQFPGSPAGIEIKILFVLSHYDWLDETIISSFDYGSLARVRELAPEARIGIIYGSGVSEDPFSTAERLSAASIHVQKELATEAFLNRGWEMGLDVFVWTVNDPRMIEKYAALGVQGIISDYPERLSKLVRKSTRIPLGSVSSET
jgi:glycerophosphoryl diester phosphodiesterase